MINLKVDVGKHKMNKKTLNAKGKTKAEKFLTIITWWWFFVVLFICLEFFGEFCLIRDGETFPLDFVQYRSHLLAGFYPWVRVTLGVLSFVFLLPMFLLGEMSLFLCIPLDFLFLTLAVISRKKQNPKIRAGYWMRMFYITLLPLVLLLGWIIFNPVPGGWCIEID